ncbi:ABC transporter G family member 5-like [Typha angustifolia]|uniref:ABC transporter G family member 5-like n=1 Tax=Typha angustifolia TaxID=59011 RepID=UPI003C3045E3
MARLVDKLPLFERELSPMGETGDESNMPPTSAAGSSSSPHVILEVPNVGQPGPTGRPQFVLAFSDLSYSIHKPRRFSLRGNCRLASDPVTAGSSGTGTRMLLNSISGEAREGEILAVLGASGSGKSTLIDALANRISRDRLLGHVTLNGEHLESSVLRSISAYVMQDDLLYPMLTVEETLSYSADLRLPSSLPASKKRTRVQDLIDQLGLRNAANTIIGDEGHRGVSGGERRRVSIGVDVIHDPIILFLDEPTSGLDSTSAFLVVQVLQRIARSGSVVIMSIHQPSYRILSLLDHLLFLSRGETVYYGKPSGLSPFLSEFGRPVPVNENPTEFALDLIRELESSPEGAHSLVMSNSKWQAKQPRDPRGDPEVGFKEAITASISRGKLVTSATSALPSYANSFWVEMGVLTRRSFTNTRRMPELYIMRLGTVMITGFILATIFWRLDDSPKGIQERLGFFAIAMSTMFYTCADALPVFLQERYIFMRETAHNAYRRISYVLSHTIVGFPPLVFLSLAFGLITFFAVGLSGGASGFVFFTLVVLASFWAGSGFVTFLSGVVPHVMLGYTVVVAILAYFLLFCGFFINRDRIPDYWIWFHYLSLVKYPYEAVLQNEFSDPTRCFVRGVQMFDNTPLESLAAAKKVELLKVMSSSIKTGLNSTTCITTGPEFLKQQAITDLSKWSCLWVTVAWGFFFRILFYVTLLLGSKNKRK